MYYVFLLTAIKQNFAAVLIFTNSLCKAKAVEEFASYVRVESAGNPKLGKRISWLVVLTSVILGCRFSMFYTLQKVFFPVLLVHTFESAGLKTEWP